MLRFIAAPLWPSRRSPPLPALAHPHIFIDATRRDHLQRRRARSSRSTTPGRSTRPIRRGRCRGSTPTMTARCRREELQPLADDNMQGLADYEYYTFAGEGERPQPQASATAAMRGSSTMNGSRRRSNFDVRAGAALCDPQGARDRRSTTPNITSRSPSRMRPRCTLINAPDQLRACGWRPAKEMPDELADALYALPPDVTQAAARTRAGAARHAGRDRRSTVPAAALHGRSRTRRPWSPATALDAVNGSWARPRAAAVIGRSGAVRPSAAATPVRLGPERARPEPAARPAFSAGCGRPAAGFLSRR